MLELVTGLEFLGPILEWDIILDLFPHVSVCLKG